MEDESEDEDRRDGFSDDSSDDPGKNLCFKESLGNCCLSNSVKFIQLPALHIIVLSYYYYSIFETILQNKDKSKAIIVVFICNLTSDSSLVRYIYLST